jgi:lipopolysaccharide export system permease protein
MEVRPAYRPRLLERYITREYLKLFGLSLATFLSVFLVVEIFERLDRLLQSQVGLAGVGRYIALRIPFGLGQVLPPAALLAAILLFSLMARNRETTAVRTCGIDILRLTRPVLVLAVLAVLLQAMLNLYIIPWSQFRLNLFWETQVLKKPARSLVDLEHFWYKGDQAIYNIVLFRKDIDTLEGVKIYFFDRQFQLVKVVAAKRAAWQGENRWRFSDGFVQHFNQGPDAWETFEERELTLTETPKDFSVLERKLTEMDLGELGAYVERLERDGYNATPYKVELDNRFALGLPPLVLAILGLGLALRREKPSIPGLVAVGVGVMFIYWLALGFSVSLGQAGRWPVLLAVWLPHLVMGAGAVSLLRRATR